MKMYCHPFDPFQIGGFYYDNSFINYQEGVRNKEKYIHATVVFIKPTSQEMLKQMF